MDSIKYALDSLLWGFVVFNQLAILFLYWNRWSELDELKKIRENQEKLLAMSSFPVKPGELRRHKRAATGL